jgi:hypothetical protein
MEIIDVVCAAHVPAVLDPECGAGPVRDELPVGSNCCPDPREKPQQEESFTLLTW